MSELLKAWRGGKRGKFRRVNGGKVKFIRSEDGVVEKDASHVCKVEKCRCVEKDASHVCKVEKCGCGVEKADFTTDVAACLHKSGEACDCPGGVLSKLDTLIKALETKLG